jgi:hypothetical protein
MKMTIESTTRIVQISHGIGSRSTPARVWEGKTEGGLAVIVLVTRIAASISDDLAELERELVEQKPPSPAAVEAIPLRFVLE